MADSFGKRQREREKQQKQREKAERKKQRKEDGTPATGPVEGVTWYELVGEEGGALPGDAGATAQAEAEAERRRKARGGAPQ